MHDYNITMAKANTGTAMRAAMNALFAELGGEMAVALLTKANAQGIAMTYAASSSNGIQVVDNGNINFGAGDFTIVRKMRLPIWAPSSPVLLTRKRSSGGLNLYTDSTGLLKLQIGNSIVASSVVTGLQAWAEAEIVASVSRTIGVIFGVNGVQLGATQSAPADSATEAVNLYITGNAATRYESLNHSCIIYNRALTASEIFSLYGYGIDPADMYGCQTALYTSDFSAGVDAWATAGGLTSVTGNVDGIAGEDNWLGIQINSSLDTHKIYHAFSGLEIGKRYEISLKYYIPSGQSNLNGIGVYSSSGAVLYSAILNVTGVATTVKIEFVATEATNIRIYMYSGAATYFQDSSGDDVAYFKNIVLKRIGAVLALHPEGIQPAPGQWLDSSSNKLHALQPASGASLIRPKRDFEVRWTNTWAGTHEAQYVGGVNQAILPADNIRIESITMRSTATGVNVILGDGSATSRFVASVALATYLDCTIANRNHDGTNRKLVIDPDANYTGSITTTIKGIILD